MTIKEFKDLLQPNIPYKIWYPNKENTKQHRFINVLKTKTFDNIPINTIMIVHDGLIIIPEK